MEYIPYLAIAEAVLDAEHDPKLFLLSLFPDASDEQCEIFRLYSLGKIHDGVIQGLEISGHDAIGEIEAYQLGVQEGLEQGRATGSNQ